MGFLSGFPKVEFVENLRLNGLNISLVYFSTDPTFENPPKNPTSYLVKAGF